MPDLPTLIWGARVPTERSTSLALRNGASAEVGYFDAALRALLLEAAPNPLSEVPLQEIIAFLNRAGRNWRNKGYTRRSLYLTHLQTYLGYSREAAEAETDRIASLLTSHSRAYDLVATELGNRYMVDEWVRAEDSWVRALPRGLTMHLLPGNVPIAIVLSLVRGLLTKNRCIAKLPSGDLFTALAFAASLSDVDGDHPVARALSVLYWEHDNSEARLVAGAADAICAWGGADAVGWAHRWARPDTSFACFGPKRSLAIIGKTADLASAARGVAHDVSIYDQRACFSTQRVFVEGKAARFRLLLEEELDKHAKLLPPTKATDDEACAVMMTRLEELYLGSKVRHPASANWTVVEAKPRNSPDHPLGRTVYVHSVGALTDAYEYIDSDVQTVAAAPWGVLGEHRDALARRGVSRFTEVGMSNMFRVGSTHDGINPLRSLVRIVCQDAPAAVHGKGMLRRIDQTDYLQAGDLRELVV
jgi:long-chain-fatty-acyl-CoA reductase